MNKSLDKTTRKQGGTTEKTSFRPYKKDEKRFFRLSMDKRRKGMKIIGVILILLGACVGFGAKFITQFQFKNLQRKQPEPLEDDQQDLEDFQMLLENSVLLIKIIGLVLVATGFTFIFILG